VEVEAACVMEVGGGVRDWEIVVAAVVVGGVVGREGRGDAAGTGAAAVGEDGGEHLVRRRRWRHWRRRWAESVFFLLSRTRYEGSRRKGRGEARELTEV